MNCNHAEHLLSLNLDGRLSSGQRQLLSQHLTACKACGAIDRELVAARELALSLPSQRVSEGFREELWQRIRSGEGTPEAVFREPVPVATKVRYFVTGAAAAGLMILASRLVRTDPPELAPNGTTARALPTMESKPDASGLGRLVPRDNAPVGLVTTAGVVPATPDSLAELMTTGYTDSVRTLHAQVQHLEAQQVTPELLESLRSEAGRARSFAGMLRWMVEGKYMILPAAETASLTAIEVVGEQVRAFDDADSLRRVLRPIRSIPMEQTSNYFCTPCVKDESSFNQEFLVRLRDSQLERAIGAEIMFVQEPALGGHQRVRIFIKK